MAEFSVSILLKKVATRLVTLGVAWLSSKGLGNIGITIDPTLATASIFGALEALRNILKVKFGLKWL